MNSLLDLLGVATGGALVLLVVYDMGLTVLHPIARGPLTYGVNRAAWALFRRLGGRERGRRRLALAGPVSMGASFLAWVAGLWLGFALVFLPFLDSFSYQATVPFGERGLAEALYVSGATLTTVGYGDVVAGTDALRILSVLESGGGLAAITAAITYLLSVHSAVSELRASAVAASQLRLHRPADAIQVVRDGGVAQIGQVHRELIRAEQHLRRFPVLYAFHPPRREESLVALVHGAMVLAVVLRWHVDSAAAPFAERYGRALQEALGHVLAELDADAMHHGHLEGDEEAEAWPEHEARRAHAHLCRTLREAAPEVVRDDSREPPAGFAAAVGHATRTLQRLAEAHGYPAVPLLDGTSAPEEATARV